MSWIQSVIEKPENNTKLKVSRNGSYLPFLMAVCFGLPDFVFGFIMILMSISCEMNLTSDDRIESQTKNPGI